MKQILCLLILVITLTSCQTFWSDIRPIGTHPTATIERANETPLQQVKFSDKELEKYAYELGFDPKKGLTPEQRESVLNRRKVRELERTLDSAKERQHYSKILPLIETDNEKIEYLTIDSIEGRQAWVNRNKIWSRQKSNPEFLELVEAQDIAVGMSADLVRKSWGEPESVEVSGNEVYKNERWRYTRDVPTPNGYKRERRFVFFEGGRVVGWETE